MGCFGRHMICQLKSAKIVLEIFMLVSNIFIKFQFHQKNNKSSMPIPILYLLPPAGKNTLMFFALRALQFWEMALGFHYYLGIFGPSIFPGLNKLNI